MLATFPEAKNPATMVFQRTKLGNISKIGFEMVEKVA
jgi:hypothetical protein